MRTVQEILKALDTERLIDTYLYHSPIRYEAFPDKTVQEIQDRFKAVLRDFISRLRNMEIHTPEDGSQCLFYVHRCIRDEFDEVSFCLIDVDEFLEKDYDCRSYAYEFTEQAEIMGYLVAETPLMNHYIYDLMAEIMDEASFFGFEQERLKEERDELGRRIREVENMKNGENGFIGESWEDVRKEMGLDSLDQESPDEKEIHDEVRAVVIKYSDHSMRKELDAVRELLKDLQEAKL